MAHDVYYPYAVDIDSVLIEGVSEQGIDPAVSEIRPRTDGLVDPKNVFTGTADPVIRISTSHIAEALGKITFDGLALAVANPATLFCQKAASGGTRAGATSHLKLVVQAGMAVPITARAGSEAPGTLDFELHAMDDLSNDAFTFTASQSLAGTPALAELFYAGPVKLNNTSVDGVSDITVNFGLALRKRRAAGIVEPTHISVEGRASSISIATDDASLIATYKKPVAIASATLAYFRKAATAGRVAEATAQHISFTVNQGIIVSRGVAGGNQMGAIDIIPTYDGSNAMIAIDTAVAIT